MKRILCLLLVCILLSGCAAAGNTTESKIFEATYLTLFDTITVIKGSAQSKEVFTSIAQSIHDELNFYHQLFDIYQDYEGLNNLKTVNDMAGVAPVKVDRKIIDLLLDCKDYHNLTGGKVNVAMGSVLNLWHIARNDGINDPMHAKVPDGAALQIAAQHTSIDAVVIDEEASTVFISDPDARLDVGAVAKGWSVQRVADNAPAGLLISVGGNVCATGPKDANGTPWVVGIQNPAGDDYLHTIYASQISIVTSGDYQRYYRVNDKIYHHIIDPATLFPSTYWRSVSIICPDSGLADALSTALFIMDREEGMALAESCGAEAMWVAADGQEFMTVGFEKMLRT